jgi:GNAT superfamily N-acetyltransferase
MREIVVRRATPGDAAALALVGAAAFLESYAHMIGSADMIAHIGRHYGADAFAAFLANPDCALWIAELGEAGAPIGFSLLTLPDLPLADIGPCDVELRRIYSLSRFHGGGLGWRLLKPLIDCARAAGRTRLFVGVHDGNTKAIAFYRRAGFADAGRRTFRVGVTDYDDLVMAMSLA